MAATGGTEANPAASRPPAPAVVPAVPTITACAPWAALRPLPPIRCAPLAGRAGFVQLHKKGDLCIACILFTYLPMCPPVTNFLHRGRLHLFFWMAQVDRRGAVTLNLPASLVVVR